MTPSQIFSAEDHGTTSESNISSYSHPSIQPPLTKTESPFSDLLEESYIDDVDITGKSNNELIPPILSSVENPIDISSEGELKASLELISGLLSIKDPEAWDKRMEALSTLERVIAGRSIRQYHESLGPNSWIISNFRKMPMEEQLEDLRSIITGQACRVVAALAYELRNEFAPLAEKWVTSILHLSISGVRVMAQQGMNCIMQITSFPGLGYPRLLPLFNDGCTGKHHPNYKRSCVIALTNALRVWMCQAILERNLKAISKAVMSAATDRDPQVRENGRKAFWALYDRFETAAAEILTLFDSSSRKNLQKVRKEATSEWEDGGPMNLLSRGFDTKKVTQAHQSNVTSNTVQGSSRVGGGHKKSLLPNGGGAPPKSSIQSVFQQSQDIAVIGTSLKSSSSSKTKFPTSASNAVRVKTPIPESSQKLKEVISSTPQTISVGQKKSRLEIEQTHLSWTPNQIYAATPEREIHHINPSDKQDSQLKSSEIFELSDKHAKNEGDNQFSGGTFTIHVFLNTVSDPDWSIRENSLSLFAATFSALEDSTQQKFDLDSFVYADHELQEKFVLSLARSIHDINLCVSMSSLEAINCVLLHSIGQKILYNFLHILLPPLLNKQFADTERESDRLVDDCLDAIQLCIFSPTTLEPVMVDVLKLFDSENFEQLSESAQFRLYNLLCRLLPHAEVFLETRHNLSAVLEASILFANKTSPFSFGETLKPLFDSLFRAADFQTIVSELSKVKNEQFFAAITNSDEEWARAVMLTISREGSTKADTNPMPIGEGAGGNTEKTSIEKLEATPVKHCPLKKNILDKSYVDENQCLMDEGQLHRSEGSLWRTPLASMNRNTHLTEGSKSRFQTPDSDPVLRYMTRPSPISAMKFCKDTIQSEVRLLLAELCKYELSHELYIAMQSLLQLARDQEYCFIWDEYFVEFFKSILKGVNEFPSSKMTSDDATEARHLYLQGLRVLLKFHSYRFKNFVDEVVQNMMNCCNDVNSHIVHAAERVLESLVLTQDACSCFLAIRPYVEFSGEKVLMNSSSRALSALRTMVKVVPRLDQGVLKESIPPLFPSLVQSIIHDSVDIRKATVFLLVEVAVIVEESDLLPLYEQLTLAQRRLLSYYVDRRQRNCL